MVLMAEAASHTITRMVRKSNRYLTWKMHWYCSSHCSFGSQVLLVVSQFAFFQHIKILASKHCVADFLTPWRDLLIRAKYQWQWKTRLTSHVVIRHWLRAVSKSAPLRIFNCSRSLVDERIQQRAQVTCKYSDMPERLRSIARKRRMAFPASFSTGHAILP